MSEKRNVEEPIKRWLLTHGCYFNKNHGSAFQRKGLPDIFACVNGRFVAIETKAFGKVASEHQQIHLDNIKKANGIAFVADTAEQGIEILEKIICGDIEH